LDGGGLFWALAEALGADETPSSLRHCQNQLFSFWHFQPEVQTASQTASFPHMLRPPQVP
jgi:hypothetical protein